MTMNLKRLSALVLALLLPLGGALAEEIAPMDAPAETPVIAEAPAEELGEIALPLEGEPAPEAAADAQTVAAQPAEPIVEADPDAMVAAPGDAPVLAIQSLAIGAKDKLQLSLANGAEPRSAVYASSDPKIVQVNADGLLSAKKAGQATITADAGGVVSSCAVTVVPAPKKVALSAKKLELGAGEGAALGVTVTPADTLPRLAFISSNPGVAYVDASGIVVGQNPGTATITVSAYNGKKAKCKVTVKPAPTSIGANVGALSMWLGRAIEIEPILSPGSGGSVWLSSSDYGVVTIEGATARAVGMGSAVITLATYNGLYTQIPVSVTKAPVYRALLIGEGSFPDSGLADLPGGKDVALMENMLRGVKGPSGEPWQISTATNLTAEQIHGAIQNAFAGAEAGDVSLFYISTHGDEEYTLDGLYGSYAGCLVAYPDYRYSQWYDRYGLTLGRLAGWLCEVPGQAVVLIDSCGSGAAIYGAAGVSAPALSPEDFDGAAQEIEGRPFSPQAFDQAVVDAFRSVDTGVLAAGQGAFIMENKFFVLTSCGYRETGWSLKNKYSYFTKWLTGAIKTKGRMPADSDKNRYTTLNELFNYMKKLADKKTFKYEGVKYKQHVQVYPANSGLELFYR